MNLTQKLNVHFKNYLIASFLLVFSRSVFANSKICNSYKNLYSSGNLSEILNKWKQEQTLNSCAKNIVAIVKIESGSRSEGLQMLSDLSMSNFAPATVNLAIELEQKSEFNSSNILAMYQTALEQSLINPISHEAFNLSWGRGNALIKRCLSEESEFCKSLKLNTNQVELFRQVSDVAIKIAASQIAETLSDRRAVETAILGALTIGTAIMIKNSAASARAPSAKPVIKEGVSPQSNGLGLSDKMYLCMLGHISSGARHSTCH